jgi:arginyl-tRNA synthetase
VNLEKYNLATLVVLKSDGTALYITKDIAMAKERFEKQNPDKMIYVVGNEQALHFRQLFKILDLYGFRQAKDCYHLSYELVRLKEGKMSSRAGNVILYQKLYEQALAKSLTEMKERHPDWAEKKNKLTAEKISLAALKFGMLKQGTNEIITFDLDEALEFQGFTGPYLLYTVARINSIFNKIKDLRLKLKVKKVDYSLLKEQSEVNLVKKLGEFPEVIAEIVKSNEPAHLARYLFELAQEFNTLYHELPILKAEAGVREARLELINMVNMVLERGLGLLGIETLEEM